MPRMVSAVTGAVGRALGVVPKLQHKQLDREMANLIMRSGGRLTDSVEFEIMQRALGGTSHLLEAKVTERTSLL